MGRGSKILILLSLLPLTAFAGKPVLEAVDDAPVESPVVEQPADPGLEVEQGDTVFNKKSGFNLNLGANPDQNGVVALIVAKLMGKDLSVLEAASKTTNLLDGETELTLAGMRVWSDRSSFKNGKFTYSAGMPTTQSRLPIVAIPVGPVVVKVDAGLAYDAAVEGKLEPHFSIPIEYTAIGAELAAKADIAGFIEGYAQFLFLRGGVGGQIDILRGKAALQAELAVAAAQRKIQYSGYLQTLSGKFYAFVDSFNLFRFRWKRILQPTIADWKGFCFQLNKNHPDPEAPCGN